METSKRGSSRAGQFRYLWKSVQKEKQICTVCEAANRRLNLNHGLEGSSNYLDQVLSLVYLCIEVSVVPLNTYSSRVMKRRMLTDVVAVSGVRRVRSMVSGVQNNGI